jgi:hypothetical protein
MSCDWVLRAGGGGQLDVVDTRRVQGFGGGSQRRASGDDIIDHEDGETVSRLPGTKCRTDETLGTRLACLRSAVCTVQETPARNAELTGHGARDCLGLVVPAPLHSASAGGRPGHHIHICEFQTADHVCGQHAGGRTSVPELERDDQLPGCSLERECGANALGTSQRTNRREREPARVAQDLAGSATGCAASGEQHGVISTRRV